MGAVVITVCRPTGAAALILVLNFSGSGLSEVSDLFSSQEEISASDREYLHNT